MKILRSRSAQSPPLVVMSRAIIVIVPLRVGEVSLSPSTPLLSLGSLVMPFNAALVTVHKRSRLMQRSTVWNGVVGRYSGHRSIHRRDIRTCRILRCPGVRRGWSRMILEENQQSSFESGIYGDKAYLVQGGAVDTLRLYVQCFTLTAYGTL